MKEDAITIPLHDILCCNGYLLNNSKSCVNSVCVQRGNETLIITSYQNGHYLYFNPQIRHDRGNIFNYCKNRKIKAETLLKNYIPNLENKESKERKATKSIKPKDDLKVKIERAKERINELKSVDLNEEFFKIKKISKETIENFKYKGAIKKNNYNDICFRMFIPIVDEEKSCFLFSGVSQRLLTPHKKDKDGNIFERPRKIYCHGVKGVELLYGNKLETLKDAEVIIISESIIDSLSMAELLEDKHDFKKGLLLSTVGNFDFEKTLKPFLDQIIKSQEKEVKIYLVFDNDDQGKIFSEIVFNYLNKSKRFNFQNLNMVIPEYCKDANDLLKLKKITAEKEINKEAIERMAYFKIDKTNSNKELNNLINSDSDFKFKIKEAIKVIKKEMKLKEGEKNGISR